MEVIRRRRDVRLRGDPDSIHDLRVATRRLQEALDIFAPCLPGSARQRLARRSRRIRRQLGGVRNVDVTGRLLERIAGRFDARSRRALAALRAELAAEAATLRRASSGGGALRVPGIRKRSRAVLAARRAVSAPALLQRGRAVAATHLKALARTRPRALTGRPRPLHRVRIALKHYRYALEILEAGGMAGVRPAIAIARLLQERLGDLHDLDVLIERVRAAPGLRARAAVLRRLRGIRRILAASAVSAVGDFDPASERRRLDAAFAEGG